MNDIEKAIAGLKNLSGGSISYSADISESGQSKQPSEYLPETDIDLWSIDSDFSSEKPALNRTVNFATERKAQIPVIKAQNDQQNGPEDIKPSKIHELPLAALSAAGYITPNTPKSKITEEYRRIKRPLLKRLAASGDKRIASGNVVAVTSAMSGEGKTFSAINLAMSLALERDRTVLLIDADVVKHTAGHSFEVTSKQPGLIDLLDDSTLSSSDVILKTNVERLNFLPAGRHNEHANELLSSDRMRELIAEFSGRHDERIIIMDCPPVMQTNEAAILVDHAGQIVFVVAEEQTSQGIVTQALRLIGNEKKVGILLNKSTTKLGHYDYYNYAYS